MIDRDAEERIERVGETAAGINDTSRSRESADAGIKADSHGRPICAIPMRDVAYAVKPDTGERPADIHIASVASDGAHAIRAAGSSDCSATDIEPVRSVESRDTVDERSARRSEQSANVNAVVRLT